jgi:DinB superfamily
MTDPIVVAAAENLDDSLRAMREVIVAADPQALDWRPGEDTNPIAVLVVHSMHSTRMWLSVAMGAPVPARDRPSEFLATADGVDELLGFFDAMAAECRALLDTTDPFDAGAVRPTGRDDQETATGAYALLHALEHLREHVAHAQLTRQLWEMDRAR